MMIGMGGCWMRMKFLLNWKKNGVCEDMEPYG